MLWQTLVIYGIISALSGICAMSCATISVADDKVMNKNFGEIEWLNQEVKKPIKAVVLIVHGLNLKPERMDDFGKEFLTSSCEVLRVSLTGHEANKHIKDISADAWRSDFDKAIEEAYSRAKVLNVPIYFLGFSLGSLVGLEWLSRNTSSQKYFKKMVLIAPAIVLPWYAGAVNIFSIFGKDFILPSRSPKSYRANNGISVGAYKAMFALKESLEKTNYKNANIDTLVIMDRLDELVPSIGIRKIIERARLSHWQLKFINNNHAEKKFGLRHLLVDRESLGLDNWQTLMTMLKKHLGLS